VKADARRVCPEPAEGAVEGEPPLSASLEEERVREVLRTLSLGDGSR